MNDKAPAGERPAWRARSARRQFPATARPLADATAAEHVPVAIAGAGPVGLALAIDLAQRGIRCVVLERGDSLADGSRAICWSKRTLEICARLGIATRMMDKGVTWNVGRVFCGAVPEPLFSFDLLPDGNQQFPAFINLQQYYTEEYLVERLATLPAAALRWRHEVVHAEPGHDAVGVTVQTPAGLYRIRCRYLVAADGCRSALRSLLGLDFAGRDFADHFLIADVRMRAPFPAERRFYFDAPFNEGRTALLHRQPDDVCRLDFQLGCDVDRGAATSPAQLRAKIHAMLGPAVEYGLEWVSLYTFQCRRMQRFLHGRVIFAGDAAHLVSPFGARGANGGIQDADNLGWKLAAVLDGAAPDSLLESYDCERVVGADENIRNSTFSTDFMTPKSAAARAFRDAVLELAVDVPFARALVNSGRLSVPCALRDSPLNTPDAGRFDGGVAPGVACIDAPLGEARPARWLLERLGGRFVCLHFRATDDPPPAALPPGVALLGIRRAPARGADGSEVLRARYDAEPGTTYLIRPDQHVAARARRFDAAWLEAAWRRASGQFIQA